MTRSAPRSGRPDRGRCASCAGAGALSGQVQVFGVSTGRLGVEGFFSNSRLGGVWFVFTASPLRDSEGRIVGAIETLVDVTRLKNLRQTALQEAHDDLEQQVLERTGQFGSADQPSWLRTMPSAARPKCSCVNTMKLWKTQPAAHTGTGAAGAVGKARFHRPAGCRGGP